MSRQDRSSDSAWLAESLSAVLAADPATVGRRASATGDRDPSWAGLMGPAGMSFTPSDLRIDDVTALIIGLFEIAVEEAEWLETADLGDGYAEEPDAVDDDDAEHDDGVEHVLADDSHTVDDRTLHQAQWSVLVENWWRAAPPFGTTSH